MSKLTPEEIIGGLEELLKQARISERKIEYSSSIERIQRRLIEQEERIERLESVIIKIRESL